MKMPELQILDIRCDCFDQMHRMAFQYDDSEMFDVSVSIMMNAERPWHKRIIPGIRFILGLRGTNDWHYTDVIMRKHMVVELQKYLDQYQKDRTAYWDHQEGKTDEYTPIRGYTPLGHQ